MLIRDRDGDILRVKIAPAFMTVITAYDENDHDGRAAEFPGATLATWEWEIIEASDEERALMREHGILPEKHTLWVEDEKGERHAAHIDFAPTLNWGRLGCASARDIVDGDAFNGCRIVEASPSDIALLRRFGFNPARLDEVEERLERDVGMKRAA